MPEFVLQFPVEHVSDFASRYEYATDEEVLAIGKAARERGYYLFDEFVNVADGRPRAAARTWHVIAKTKSRRRHESP